MDYLSEPYLVRINFHHHTLYGINFTFLTGCNHTYAWTIFQQNHTMYGITSNFQTIPGME